MRIYIAGPMRRIPEFNFPAFHRAAEKLRSLGHTVFNPAERDIERFGRDVSKGNLNGDEKVAAAHLGIDAMTLRRMVFADDMNWIALNADAICLLPGWKDSGGALAEFYLAKAIGLNVYYIGEFLDEHGGAKTGNLRVAKGVLAKRVAGGVGAVPQPPNV